MATKRGRPSNEESDRPGMATMRGGPFKEDLDRPGMATRRFDGLKGSGNLEDLLSKDSPVEISSDDDAAVSRVQRMRKEAAENETSDEDEDGERRVKRGEKDGGTGGCLMAT
eukprot:7766524-Karenia_brevis.AAC.1